MSKATRKILKKFDGMIIDYEEGKDWAELSVEKNYIASIYRPFSEKQRQESRKYLEQLSIVIGDMLLKLDNLELLPKEESRLSKMLEED